MLYISPNNEYPRHIGDVQLASPEWQEGEPLPAGWLQVQDSMPPSPDVDEVVYEDFPIEIDGVLTRNWKVRAMTAEEIERRDAPKTAKAKLLALGLTEVEIEALTRGYLR